MNPPAYRPVTEHHIHKKVVRAVRKIELIEHAARWARDAITDKEMRDKFEPVETLSAIVAEFKEKANALAKTAGKFHTDLHGKYVDPDHYVAGEGCITIVWGMPGSLIQPVTFDAFWEDLFKDESQ